MLKFNDVQCVLLLKSLGVLVTLVRSPWWPLVAFVVAVLRIFYIYNASTQYCYRVTIGQLVEDSTGLPGLTTEGHKGNHKWPLVKMRIE